MIEMPPELNRRLEEARGLLESSGAGQWEIMAAQTESVSVGVKNDQVDNFAESTSLGLAVRVVKDQRLGFAFILGGEGREGLEQVVREALASAEASDPEPGVELAGPSAIPEAGDELLVYDPALATDPLEAKVDRARRLARAAREADSRVTHVHPAQFSAGLTRVRLVTSLGLDRAHQGTRVGASVNAMASGPDGQEMAWESGSGCFLEDVDVEWLGALAGKKAASMLGGGPVPDGRYDVVLENSVTADFLGILADSFLGDNLLKGRSLLAGREGQAIVSPLIGIVDDGLLPRRPGSAPFDDEGTPQGKTVLVDKGVLRSFVFDRLWGMRAGAGSTGNAVRGSLKAPVGVGFTNLFIEPGQGGGLKEMTAALGNGLLIEEILGGHTADPVSGEFSFGAAGHLVEDGRITRPVKSVAIAGKVLDVFASVTQCGSDLRFFGRTGAPSLIISGLSVSGS